MRSTRIVNTRVAEDTYERLRECSSYLRTGSISELVIPGLIQRGKVARIIKDRGIEKEKAEGLFTKARALAMLSQEDDPEEIRRLGDLFQRIGSELDEVHWDSECAGGVNLESPSHSGVRAKFINIKLCDDTYEDLKATCEEWGNTVSNVLYYEILRWCSAVFIAKERGLIPDRETSNLQVVMVTNLVLTIPDRGARRRFAQQAQEWAYRLAELKERAFELGDVKAQ